MMRGSVLELEIFAIILVLGDLFCYKESSYCILVISICRIQIEILQLFIDFTVRTLLLYFYIEVWSESSIHAMVINLFLKLLT